MGFSICPNGSLSGLPKAVDETCMGHVALFYTPVPYKLEASAPWRPHCPPRPQTRPFLGSTSPYRVDSLIHAFKPKPFHLQLNISSYSYFLSPFANRNRQIVGNTVLSSHYCPSQPAVCAYNSLLREKNGKKV